MVWSYVCETGKEYRKYYTSAFYQYFHFNAYSMYFLKCQNITSHVLMCVDSHSWRTLSNCSMLDMYYFSSGPMRTIRQINEEAEFILHLLY